LYFNTPAGNHLFEVDPEAEQLDEDTAQTFHRLVAKLLSLCKRARPDIQTAVAFLCTRVKSPDVDDWKKLRRVMLYLRGTPDLPLTLKAGDMSILKWWIDASFATHADMKSHTSVMLTLGKGAAYAASTKKKLNTKSSTESKVIGVDDGMPPVLWTRYFLEAQGYGIEESIINQDNQSSILLENNGRGSSSKRTRHINIRYYFVTNRVAAGDVRIQYCLTGVMVADYFTKPLQGTAFRQFRDQIMNIDDALPLIGGPIIRDPALTDGKDRRSVLENEENADAHGWTKVVRNRASNRRTKLQETGVGLQPNAKGLQITAEGFQPTNARKRRAPVRAAGVGLHPTGVGLQPANGINRSVSRLNGRHDKGTGGHIGPRKTTRSRKERKVEKR
jgi:hypothetical protein